MIYLEIISAINNAMKSKTDGMMSVYRNLVECSVVNAYKYSVR